MDTGLLDCLRDLENTTEADHLIQQLRRIKNEIVGHGLRKELVVTNGILGKLEAILATYRKAVGKRNEEGDSPLWTQDWEVQLQSTIIIDTLANGGPSFVSPILLSNVLVHLFDNLSDAPARIVIASLRALNSLAYSALLGELNLNPSIPSPLALQAFAKTNCAKLIRLLKTPVHTLEGKQVVDLTAGLIDTTCKYDHSRAALARAGALEALAAVLTDYARHEAHWASRQRPGSKFPHLPSKTVRKILSAICAIIRNSNYRVFRLLLASSLWRFFNGAHDAADDRKTAAEDGERFDPNKYLPSVMAPMSKSVSFGVPEVAILHPGPERLPSELISPDTSTMDPFSAWLEYMARYLEGPAARLAALRLVAMLQAAFAHDTSITLNGARCRWRERSTVLLDVPLAVKLVQDAVTTFNLPNDTSEDTRILQEDACAVLALMIGQSSELQKAAVEAGAIKHVSLMLKKSFEPVGIARPMWSAQQKEGLADSKVPSSQLGDPGLPSEIAHVMEIRSGALRALAAIAQREDMHRKAIIDQGIVGHVIDSLKPITDGTPLYRSSASVTCNFNTAPALVSACEAARSLSRSVSLLRTSLIDAGIAKPILALLHHPNTNVQIAATSDIMAAGAIKIFSEHARQSDPQLRVGSLWALKHLVLGAPKAVRIEVLEELGPAWLVQAINGAPPSDANDSASSAIMSSNAFGEQVSLLNAPTTPDMDLDDVSAPAPSHSNTSSPPSSGPHTPPTSALRSTLHPSMPNFLSTLRQLRLLESSPAIQRRAEEAGVTEQALDLIRNLINGDESSQMLDHLSASIGLSRLFEILHSKISSPPPFSSSSSTTNPPPHSATFPASAPYHQHHHHQKPDPDPTVHAAINVLVHIAAASARHRQLVVAQRPLLRSLMPCFSARDHRVRVACLWLVINLTWVEDQADREDARRRAQELRALGLEERVRALMVDEELDVRERCKVAARQLDELLVGAGRGR